MSTTLRRNMICNTVVLAYMLLASFPCIGEEERAAVQLVLEHIFTFNTEIGRIVLTRQSYEHAQGLLPQLLVLASRHGLVYAAGRTPSFMNMATILQTIVEPLVVNLNTPDWTELYETRDEPRQLLELSLPRLQAAVDTWVCNRSEATLQNISSNLASPTDYMQKLAARKHADIWWNLSSKPRVPALPIGSEVIPFYPAPTPPIDLPRNSVVLKHEDKQPTRGSQVDLYTLNSSAFTLLDPVVSVPPNCPSRNLGILKHKDVSCALPLQTHIPPTTHPATACLKLAPTPPVNCSLNLVARGHGDVWWASLGQNTSTSTPVLGSHKPDLQKHKDVWWTSLSRVNAWTTTTAPKTGVQPSTIPVLINNQAYIPDGCKYTDVWWKPTAAVESMQPQSTRPDELRLPELQHPRPIRAAFLYHHMVLEEMVHRNAEVDNSTQSFVPTLPATHSASSQDMSSDPWRIREGSLYLLPLSQHVPWDARSGQYSPSRDFAISNPSFGPSTPTRSWGRQFSGSTPSFGPATPADSVSAGWDYDHYVAGLDWAPPWNEESGSEDIHARPQVEVRKAKKATMGRKLVRKLKGMLAAVRNMSA